MSQLTYRDGLIYPYEGTPFGLIDTTNAESNDALLTTEWFIAVVDATGAAAQSTVNLTANNATAIGTTGAVNGSATGAQGAVPLTGNNGTASSVTSSTATGSQGAVTLSVSTGAASGTATATGSPGAVSLAPNTGAANIAGTALGAQGGLTLSPADGAATGTAGDAIGTGAQSSIELVANAATAAGQVNVVTQALAGAYHTENAQGGYAIPSIDFTEGKMYVLFAVTSSATAPVPSITAIDGTTAHFSKLVGVTTLNNVRHIEAWLYTPTQTHSDSLTVVLDGPATSGDFTIIELTNAKSIVQLNTANGPANASGGLVTLGPFANGGNATLGFFMHNAQQANTPGAGFTAIDNGFHNNPPVSYISLFKDGPDQTVDARWTISSQWAAIGLELEYGVYVPPPPTVQIVVGGAGKKTKKHETYKSRKELDQLVYNVVRDLFVTTNVEDVSIKEVVAAVTKTDVFTHTSNFSDAYLKEIARIQAQLIIEKLRDEDEADDEQALLLLL